MHEQNRWHLKALMEGYLGLKSASGYVGNYRRYAMLLIVLEFGALRKGMVQSFGTVLRPP